VQDLGDSVGGVRRPVMQPLEGDLATGEHFVELHGLSLLAANHRKLFLFSLMSLNCSRLSSVRVN
jgi:hypothetical protein